MRYSDKPEKGEEIYILKLEGRQKKEKQKVGQVRTPLEKTGASIQGSGLGHVASRLGEHQRRGSKNLE